MRYFYLHGFNGGAPSRTGIQLAKLLNTGVFCLQYDYSQPFKNCFASLQEQLTAARADEICLMGVSLGGFYALSLRHPAIRKVVAWNPVVFPALQLSQFLGWNIRFNDGVKWKFEKETALSYATAPDPRVWNNFLNLADSALAPRRLIFLGLRDEILDSALCAEFWRGFADIRFINAAHSVEDYSCLLDIDPDLRQL